MYSKYGLLYSKLISFNFIIISIKKTDRHFKNSEKLNGLFQLFSKIQVTKKKKAHFQSFITH